MNLECSQDMANILTHNKAIRLPEMLPIANNMATRLITYFALKPQGMLKMLSYSHKVIINLL